MSTKRTEFDVTFIFRNCLYGRKRKAERVYIHTVQNLDPSLLTREQLIEGARHVIKSTPIKSFSGDVEAKVYNVECDDFSRITKVMQPMATHTIYSVAL